MKNQKFYVKYAQTYLSEQGRGRNGRGVNNNFNSLGTQLFCSVLYMSVHPLFHT